LNLKAELCTRKRNMFKLFKSQKPAQAAKPLTVDFHSHFLPGIDDGCPTLEDSMSLIKQMQDYGYTHLFMSPHVMGDFYKNTPEIILSKLDLVRNDAIKHGINIALDATAEYYLDEWFSEKVRTRALLPFGKEKNILFEISYVNEPRNLLETVFELQVAGYQPVMAHPERYPFFHDRFEEYEKLAELGCRLQVNLLSLIGYYGANEKRIAEKLFEKNLAYYVGSDAHKQRHVSMMGKVFSSGVFASASHKIHNHEII
jgi:protein-tyrosine phosphatase